ncbi:MAG TPA: HAD-IA family hydrolase [Methylomirabilota bacterium]|nr:HAD-IA family hydrolase [Methylomirabilota bacterium]
MTGPTELRALFFDAGNTLLEINYAAIRECLIRHGHRAEAEAVRHAEYQARVKLDPHLAPGSSTEDGSIFRLYIEYVLEGLGIEGPELIAQVIKELRDYNPPVGLWDVAHPEAKRLLEQLTGSGIQLGVISNSNGSVRQILEATGLAAHLQFILDSAVVGVEKPDPKIFRLALNEAGVEPRQAMYIGDLYSVDVLGARGVGMQAVLLDPIGAWGQVDCARADTLSEAVDLATGGNEQPGGAFWTPSR